MTRAFLFFLSALLGVLCLPLGAQALTVSPLRQTIIVAPGGQVTIALEATNDTQTVVNLVADVDAFTIDQDTGQAHFGAADRAKRWVEVTPKQFTLEPNESQTVAYTFFVPDTAEPRGHYLGLFVKQAPTQGGDVGVGARVGSLLFLYVGGQVQERLTIETMQADQAWYSRPPIEVVMTLENIGSIHVVPTGEVLIKKMNGVTVDSLRINPDQRSFLPDTQWARTYTFANLRWQDMGRLRVVSAMTYGQTNQQHIQEVVVWYWPIEVLVAMGGVLVLCLVFVIYRRRV